MSTFIKPVCVYVCLVPSRGADASDVKNNSDDDDSDDVSDSEIISRLETEKETELKKSDVNSFYSCYSMLIVDFVVFIIMCLLVFKHCF